MDPEVADRIENIRNDKTHGAGRLSREALEVLKLAAERSQAKDREEFLTEFKLLAQELANARPSMAPIANLVARLNYECFSFSQIELGPLKEFAQRRAPQLVQEFEEATRKAAENGAGLIKEADKILTCSYSSVILRALQKARENFEVLVAESRVDDKSYGELLAQDLKSPAIQAKVIPDQAIEEYVFLANKLLTGADNVVADGTVVNGTPTHRLASAVRRRGIPFYVLCERVKFSPQSPKLEKGFDEVPPSLITGIITEIGSVKPEEVNRYTAEVKKYLRALRE